jgi:hypothetical protein
MEQLYTLILGLGLSACCGFRVFVPMLVANIAALSGHYEFGADFQWLGTWTAFYILLSATILEIVAYYVPWLDNLLDTIALPASVIAGTLMTTSLISADLSPSMKWALGTIMGGGSAGIVQAGTTLLRFTSSTTTGGLANPIVATLENGFSIFFSILTVIIPIFVAICCVFFLTFLLKKLLRTTQKQNR